jgi:PST family polysaccharide transporter
MISFGLNLTGTHLVSFFSEQLDNVLIGRFCGAFSLGLYSRAYNLISMPTRLINWPMSSVLIPALSILQDNPEHYRRFLRRALEKLAFFGQPLAVLLIVAADEIILTLLGNQWKGAVPIFRWLGV